MRTPMPSSRWRMSRPPLLGVTLIALLSVLADPGSSRGQSPTPSGTEPGKEIVETVVVTAPTTDRAEGREAIFEAFYRTGLDTTRPYAIANVKIQKDTVTLHLKQGTLFLMKPVAGEITGAAFVGEGVAMLTPPNRTERYMLNKYYGAETLNEPFTEAVFRFSDGAEKTLVGTTQPGPEGAAATGRAVEVFRDRNGWLDGSREFRFELQFLENRISNLKGQDFFVAEFKTAKHDWVGFSHNPFEQMENLLYTRATLGAKNRMYRVPWMEWHKAADYGPTGHYLILPEKDGPRALRVRHYDMDLNFKNTKTVDWEARMQIEPLVTGLRVLRLDLDNNGDSSSRWDDTAFFPVRLASVTDDGGRSLAHTHKKDQVLVILSQPTHAGAPLTLVFKGSADVTVQLTAESFGLLQATWYPQYGYRGGRFTFHWTVRVPKPFLISGSGRVMREFEDKATDQNGLETRCDLPVDFPWIIFGRFQKAPSTYTSTEAERDIGLTIHSFPTMTISITDSETLERIGATQPVTFSLSAPLKKINGMFEEGKEVLKLYEKIYGAYPYDELHIAQMAPFMGFGQAPQGFVQLTGEAFMSQAQLTSDFFHGFFAHEIAHQWWGHQVSGATPDDQWIEEAFAEYAAGLFVKEFQGPKRFQRKLEEWRRDAKYSDKEAPIAAANTLRGPNAGRHRTNLIYQKGPYVLHMLRVQLDDNNYVKVMRTIQETYKNQSISTEMLLREVNKVTGSDFTTFFDQWFWDVGVPVFKYSWRSEKQPDGKFLITVHVSQEDKTRVKKVLMPIHIRFKDKEIPPQYRPVVQAEQDIKILSPADPKDVTLDDDRTLLAEFIKAG